MVWIFSVLVLAVVLIGLIARRKGRSGTQAVALAVLGLSAAWFGFFWMLADPRLAGLDELRLYAATTDILEGLGVGRADAVQGVRHGAALMLAGLIAAPVVLLIAVAWPKAAGPRVRGYKEPDGRRQPSPS